MLLVPIRSWAEMHGESRRMGIEFDAFWYDRVQAGVAHFFQWLGSPRQTVLAVLDERILVQVECRGEGDREIAADDAREAMEATRRAFGSAGYVIPVERVESR